MNRRDALLALTSLPATARISVAQLKPDDVIVIECDGELSQHQTENIRTSMEGIWPGRRVAVLSSGLKLKVMQG